MPTCLGPDQVREMVKKREPMLATMAATHRQKRDLLLRYERILGKDVVTDFNDCLITKELIDSKETEKEKLDTTS